MTLLLPWNRASSVGVRAMDDQHAIMMDTMNELRLALLRSHQRTDAKDLLSKLVAFTRMHFQCEERLMEVHGFPELAAHRSEHDRLLRQLEDAVFRLEQGKSVNIGEVLVFLHGWFIGHVKGLDKQYGPWLNGRGVH